jgi:hypothetical protein
MSKISDMEIKFLRDKQGFLVEQVKNVSENISRVISEICAEQIQRDKPEREIRVEIESRLEDCLNEIEMIEVDVITYIDKVFKGYISGDDFSCEIATLSMKLADEQDKLNCLLEGYENE